MQVQQHCRPIFDGSRASGMSSVDQGCAAAVTDTCAVSAGCKECDTNKCNTLPEVMICDCDPQPFSYSVTYPLLLFILLSHIIISI